MEESAKIIFVFSPQATFFIMFVNAALTGNDGVVCGC
jgi:hypothetical protein